MDYSFHLAGFADEAADSIDGQIAVTKELGWSHIELRCVDKKQIADLSDDEFKAVKDKLDEAGVGICSLG